MKKLLALLLVALMCLACFAACKDNKTEENPVDSSKPTAVVYDVEDAAAYLKNMYKKYLVETETAADYTLVSQVMKSGVVYTITWTTDRDDIKVIEDLDNKQVKIDLNEKTTVEIEYTLTATIADPDGKTATLSFKLTVPKYVLSSWAQYMAAEAGKAVVIEGYVAAVHSQSEGQKYNMLYVHDVNNAGGYYIYSMTQDPVKDLNLKKGMLVSVTGTKDIYSGTHEIKDASVSVLDSNVTDFAPLDITQLYKDAQSLKDEALVSKLGMLVTIKGVEITDQDLSEKSQYYNFKLSGLTSYVRLYRTDCPCSVSDADMKAIADGHTAKKGWSADVTGVVVMYGGAIYLNPVSKDCFKYGSLIQRTDAEKVDVEIEDLNFETDITLNKTIELPSKGASYENVSITWVSNSPAIEIKDGKAIITLQDTATTASITGTFKLNAVTKTHTITFKLAKKLSIVPQEVSKDDLKENTPYLLFFSQPDAATPGYYYYNGEVANTYYGGSTNDYKSAVDVYVEKTGTDGYYLYFMNGTVKTYITILQSGTHYNFTSTADKTAVINPFKWNADKGTLAVTIGEKAYFMGTYGTYTTFSAGDSQKFPAYLGVMVDTTTISDADKVASEKNGLSVESDEIYKDGSFYLDLKGKVYSEVAITWASDNACAVIADGKVTFTLQDTEQTVKLTATLKLGNVTETKEFTIKVDARASDLYAPIFTNAPAAGNAYKFAIQQNNLGQTLYVTGEVDGRYLATTNKIANAIDVYVEAVTDGNKFYILDGETKKYITIYNNESGKLSVKYDAAGTTVYTYVAETNIWKTTFEGTDYYLGAYNTFDTVSASKTSYINAGNTGTSQFPAEFATIADAAYANDNVTVPSANTAYKFSLYQANLGKTLYVTGEVDGRYLVTTDKIDEAIDVYAEAVTDGYKFYILDGETKKYITIYNNESGKLSVKYDAAGTTVYTYVAETNIWKTTFEGTDYYLGTYNSFDTVSASKTSYINAGNTGTAQFPANIVTVSLKPIVPVGKSEPVANTAYKFALYQANLGKTLYVTGEVDGRYLVTTELLSKAADVYVEKVTDGYKFYILDGETKKYITIYNNESGKLSVKYDAAGTTVYTYVAETNIWKTTFEGTDYYLGAYNTFNTVSASKTSYINAGNTGTAQFPANICAMEFYAPSTGEDDGEDDNGGSSSGSTTVTPTGTQVVFDFGDNKDTTTHSDGDSIGTSKSYTSGTYSLDITDAVKVYDGANDATGKSALKLGTGSAKASFKITVGADVDYVTFKVAKYKAKTTKIIINGGEAIEITTSSNDGAYTELHVDTRTVKTITFETTPASNGRCMIDSIIYWTK